MANKATVTVPASWLSDGLLPSVDLKTGEPANERTKVSATYTSPVARGVAAALFFVLGVIGVLLVLAIAQKKVTGPIAVKSATRSRNLSLAGFGALVMGIVGIAAANGLGLPEGIGFAVMIVGVLTAAGLIIAGAQKTGGAKFALSKDQQMITISKAHTQFVAAVQAQLASAARPAFAQPVSYDPTIPFAPQASMAGQAPAVLTPER